jgi:hypothetical protein
MNSLSSLFTSRKTMRVILGIIVIVGSLWIVWPSLGTPDARMKAFLAAMGAIAALLGIDIHGIALEDSAAKSAPSSQVNVGSKVDNTAMPATPATATTDAAPFTPDQLDFIYNQIRQRAQRAAHPPIATVPIDAPKGN